MIERLLAADAALARGELETAERLFGSVAEADPRNAIAAVGMGRVAAGRDDADGARTWFQRALEIDPQEAAARRLLAALDREMATPPTMQEIAPETPTDVGVPPAPTPVATRRRQPDAGTRRSLLDRVRGWLGIGRRG